MKDARFRPAIPRVSSGVMAVTVGACLALLALAWAAPTLAQQQALPARGGFAWSSRWTAVKEFATSANTLLAGALGTAFGVHVKWLLEQRSVRSAARREFAQKVTTQISNLADKHYWSLANYAGLLAGVLENYLRTRCYHLLLIWDESSQLAVRLDELATEAADNSFPHFCHLISLFDTFQFQGSNTYLEFPRLGVISHNELAPDATLEQLGRVSWEGTSP